MAGTWQEIRAARYSIMTPPPEWPAGVRPISIDGVSLFGITLRKTTAMEPSPMVSTAA
jgi:hypothetical protein